MLRFTRFSLGFVSFWGLAVVVAFIAGGNAASQTFRGASHDHIVVFSANDAEVLAKQFDQMFVAGKGEIKVPARWRDAALRVLSRNPLEADALRIFALSSFMVDQNLSVARARMRLSENVSARDLSTQLWLLEDAVTREDVAEVLRHYDRALSAHPNSRELLFPVLTAAVSDPTIRRDLSPYIKANRPWAYDFIGITIDQAANPADVADLLTRMGGSRAVPSDRPLETMMLNKLVSKNQVDVAYRYAQGMVSTREALESLGQFGFSPAAMRADLRPFTWSTVEDLGIETRFEEKVGLTVAAGSGTGGIAADRVFVLAPGAWRFEQQIEMPRLSPMARAFWTIFCLTDQGPREMLKDEIPQQPGDQRRGLKLTIAEECRATQFRLTVRGGDAQEDSTITIRSVGLARI